MSAGLVDVYHVFDFGQPSDNWLDAGIYPSHIGLESAVGKDNRTLTRSLAAENSPYYESGARITYVTPNNAWTLCAHVLNCLDGYAKWSSSRGWINELRLCGHHALLVED